MDIKWKNSKAKSVGIAMAAILVLTGCFTAFFPFFETRADSEFENPLTSTEFIDMLYSSSYIQYKYLREKSDQKTWTYGDLYVRDEYLGTYIDYSLDGAFANVPPDASAGSEALAEQVREFKENTLTELSDLRINTNELTQLMDYYAIDTKTGTSIGNSTNAALQAIAGGKQLAENPYVYYVMISYDEAGNVTGNAVDVPGDTGEFLKRVDAQSRSVCFREFYDDSRTAFVNFYNEDADEYYRYRFTLSAPSDMKIVYAMTQAQYQDFLNGYGEMSGYYTLPDYTYVRYNSYLSAGVPQVILGFWIAALVLGATAVFFFSRKGYEFQNLPLCRIPLELHLIIGVVFLSVSITDKMTELICACQKGWFLPNLSRHILEPVHLQWTVYLICGAIFYAYFMYGYVFGTVCAGLLREKAFLKEHSLLIRYWNKIVSFLKRFYQELVNFDIGTDARKIIGKLVIVNFIVLYVISLFWIWGFVPLILYSIAVYFLLKRYVKDVQDKYQNLLKATSAIAKGDFDIALSEDFGVFESYKNELRQIQTDFKKAVNEEVKSQRMKSELITNVSHDLKTPLTAIITYINLLKDPGVTEEQKQEYLSTLDKKAVRLKTLIEDLFEVSKATTNNITLNYANVDICNLIRQCYLEYEDRMEEQGLQFKFLFPEEKVTLQLDPQKTFRIFENLYTNIIKYALPSTRVYVIVKDSDEETEITVKNISRTELSVSPEELTERFVRGDHSRNTEGSGLGLAIARSFTEIQHGTLRILLDGDLFKAILTFRKWTPGQENHTSGQTAHPAPDPAPYTAPEPPFYRPSRWRTEKNLRKHGQKRDPGK